MLPITEVTDASFAAEVLASETPVLVDFWAPWNGPCLQAAGILASIAEAHAGRLRVVRLNVDENPVTAAKYHVPGMPTLHVFSHGELVRSITGARPRSALERDLRDVLA